MEINMETFCGYADYYDLLYSDKKYDIEAKNINNIIQEYQTVPTAKILNIGCGTGKHDIWMHRLGYNIKGIDLSPQMIKVANENYGTLQGIQFETGDARSYRNNEKFDAVISLFHVISYQNENEDIINVFKTAWHALNKNGLFIFDVWYGPGVLIDRPTMRIKKAEDDKNSVIRFASPRMYPNENVVKVCYDIFVVDKVTGVSKEILEEHSMRYFFYPEIKFYLQSAGFELLACLDSSTLRKTSFDSWTSYFVAKRK